MHLLSIVPPISFMLAVNIQLQVNMQILIKLHIYIYEVGFCHTVELIISSHFQRFYKIVCGTDVTFFFWPLKSLILEQLFN